MVILLLVGTFIAIFEGARWMLSYFVLSNAAAEGTRAGSYMPTSTWSITDIDADVRRATANAVRAPWIDLADSEIHICRVDPAVTSPCTADQNVSPLLSGDVIEVAIGHDFRWLPFAVGWLGTHTYPITAYHRQRID